MEASHVALAVGAAALGWWARPNPEPKIEPCICQCHCIGSSEKGGGFPIFVVAASCAGSRAVGHKSCAGLPGYFSTGRCPSS